MRVVSDAKLDHRFELFRGDSLFGIGEQAWTGGRKQRGIVILNRTGRDRVSESDIDLYRDSRAVKMSGEGDTHALVVGIFGDPIGFDSARVEREAVGFDLHCREFLEDAHKPFRCVIAASEKVGISRCPIGFVGPSLKQQRAFQNESVAIFGAAEPVKDSLEAVFD